MTERDTIRILLVDDDEDDYILTASLCEEFRHLAVEIEWASSFDQALEKMAAAEYDVFLLDYRLGGRTGLELLCVVGDTYKGTACILLTGEGDDAVDMEAMRAGACDYLVKGGLAAEMLERSLRYSVSNKRAQQQIVRMAYYDGLTGLPNRMLFQDRLRHAVARASRDNGMVGLLFLDVDDFKSVNDTRGHAVGDELLAAVTRRLQECARASDSMMRFDPSQCCQLTGRLGGDEFVVLLEGMKSGSDAAVVAERILKAMREPIPLAGGDVTTSVSIGIAAFPGDGHDGETLVAHADMAMYAAKRDGRDRYAFYDRAMMHAAVERMTFDKDLRQAVQARQFELHYQPIVSARHARTVAMEALLRPLHESLMSTSPLDIIRRCEETGWIVPLGEWILERALADVVSWPAFLTDARIAVNLSKHQLTSDLPGCLERLCREGKVSPARLEIEVTETLLLDNIDQVRPVLAELRAMGMRVSLDDFGSGFFSFKSLCDLPLDCLKIDRTLINEVDGQPATAAVTQAIVVMAHELGLEVTAEGVERSSQLERLEKLGCDNLQGFLFARPMQSRALAESIDNREVGDNG